MEQIRSKRRSRLAISVLGVAGITLLYGRISYRDRSMPIPNNSRPPDMSSVVAAARRLLGTLYDPLQGRLDNVGGRLGFVVCTDVPVLAYGKAGFSFRQALAEDYAIEPKPYGNEPGNNPSSPFFERRARNLYTYCRNRGCLHGAAETPQVGDLLFYRAPRSAMIMHVTLVTTVTPNGQYRVVEAAPDRILTGERDGRSVLQRRLELVGIGRVAACGSVAGSRQLDRLTNGVLALVLPSL